MRRVPWHRPEFRHIFYGIWVAAAVSEIWGKFGPVAGFRPEIKIWAKFQLSMLLPPPQVWRLTPCALLCLALRSVVLAWLVMQFRTHAYFSLDAAPFTAVSLRFAAYPPCFEIFTFHSVKHTGIGAHFRVKLYGIWARIRHINETYLGAFQSKLWPVPNRRRELRCRLLELRYVERYVS